MRKNWFSDLEKLFKFEITRTIYLNSERSVCTILEIEWFLTCSWRFVRSNTLEQLEFRLEKIMG